MVLFIRKTITFSVIIALLVFTIGFQFFYYTNKVKHINNKQTSLEEKLNSSLEKEGYLTAQIRNLIESNENLAKENDELSKSAKSVITQQIPNLQQNQNTKIAYLTFDDGPSNNTMKILNTLDKFHIKATFFVIGHDDPTDVNLLKLIVSKGNAIGNHTYSHNYATIYKSVDSFMTDFNKNEQFIYNVTGIKTNLARFPGGSNNTVSYRYGGKRLTHQIAQKLLSEKFAYFDWNVDSTDASAYRQPKNILISSVLTQARGKNKVVILCHDTNVKTTTADALPEIIQGLKKQGFAFDILNQNSLPVRFLK